MQVPKNMKLYHIVHIDRLRSILQSGGLYCDAHVIRNALPGTTIGISRIKEQRRTHSLTSYPKLYVGDCVPFYFCPRSVMLYIIWRANHQNLTYRGGQKPIIHLVADLKQVVNWANNHQKRWAFTTSNAGAKSFHDYNSLNNLNKVNWDAVNARFWSDEDIKAKKQAEFLMEEFFPWHLIESIGVRSKHVLTDVEEIINSNSNSYKPKVSVETKFYYP